MPAEGSIRRGLPRGNHAPGRRIGGRSFLAPGSALPSAFPPRRGGGVLAGRSPVTVAGPRRIRTGFPALPSMDWKTSPHPCPLVKRGPGGRRWPDAPGPAPAFMIMGLPGVEPQQPHDHDSWLAAGLDGVGDRVELPPGELEPRGGDVVRHVLGRARPRDREDL